MVSHRKPTSHKTCLVHALQNVLPVCMFGQENKDFLPAHDVFAVHVFVSSTSTKCTPTTIIQSLFECLVLSSKIRDLLPRSSEWQLRLMKLRSWFKFTHTHSIFLAQTLLDKTAEMYPCLNLTHDLSFGLPKWACSDFVLSPNRKSKCMELFASANIDMPDFDWICIAMSLT